MKNFITIALMIVITCMMIPEESQAVIFIDDDCVENGTPQQRANCLWYMQIAIMHENGFNGLYGMTTPPNDSPEIQNVTPTNLITEQPAYAVKSEHVIIWHPLRS